MQTWYVTHTAQIPSGEERGKGQSLKSFQDKESAIAFALDRLDEGLFVVAGTLPHVVPEECLSGAEIEKLRNRFKASAPAWF